MNVPGGFAYNAVMQNAAVATGNGTAIDVRKEADGAMSVVAIQVTGITTATITFEATIDDSNWVSILAENITTGAEATTATADGIYRITCLGLSQIRARVSAWTSGTITATGWAVA